MASHLSSSPDNIDSAVDALIAQVTDLCTLEQVTALAAAGLSDSPLPTALRSRLRKLQSFPAPTDPHPLQPRTNDDEKENLPTPSDDLDQENQQLQPEAKTAGDVPEVDEPTPRRSPSPPPPRRFCCFGFSPRRPRRGRVGGETELDEILSELGALALRGERRRLKKAWKEQEKASREAEKMVRWVKQVSATARMDAAAIDELLDDEEL